ncbi:16S rRNA (adenine(1518)-N(6)/adenine(1519)-N(6))-dimethyltransferase RsmA [Desulfosoma caldarium]|uniref:Ribosomal RNA small subunit methyltransferase A n=1 Tax=Desulfosoma caldarium TaxID=610254 RepID=A0A3N1VHT1_9BACT|nr:16S rRNA (adenine(1518)-N(6)/adenine(1519)-N(6))-dimethyltransferase RsmA [Desulfosoma caldarium]ROR01579.1 dimethyladenosine transferase [Desulfosoma caldarium]
MNGFLSPHEYFRRHGGRPKKRLGQHFLTQPRTAEKIVAAAHLSPDDVVVEIGPGLGILTAHLLPLCPRLHLVELDTGLADYVEEALRHRGHGARVHRIDVLRFDWTRVAKESGRRLVLVGNLPYQITSPLMFQLLEHRRAIHHGVFMVQKEVGRRLAASPGSKDYGVLSVLLSLYGRVKALFAVAPGQFYPPPKVDSLVIRIDFPESEADLGGVDFFMLRRLVNAAFQKRRKTLANSLAGFHGLCAESLRAALRMVGIDPALRAEVLTPKDFAHLARFLAQGEA